VPRTLLPISFTLEGRSLGGETLYTDAGAQVLVLTSCSAELGIELRSAYLGGEGCEELLVAESAVLDTDPAAFFTRRLESAAGAHTYERRRLLYDHLQRLQDLARGVGWELGFEGVDTAAAVLDPLAPTAR
jgi:hypothetical protein